MSYNTVNPLDKNKVSWKVEITAGLIGYLTTFYIVVVNGSILNQAGISLESGMIATILASFIGTLLMGLFAKLPLILIPGMGINALFAYSIVGGTNLTFQEGLAVVLIASIIFLITAFSRLGAIMKEAVPDTLKHGITVGLGFFLILIGLEKSGLVVSGEHSIIALGDFNSPEVIVGIITLFLAIVLFIKGIPASFLITMVIGTVLAFLFGTLEGNGSHPISFNANELIFIPSFGAIGKLSFWLAVFPLAMILIFENMGLIHGQLQMLNRNERYEKAYKVAAFSALTCAFLGTSPTVSSAENAAVIASKGRTGRAAVIASLLFLATIFIIPWISLIPNTAISPILIIVGMLMAQEIRHISLEDLSEAIPAFLIIVMIPFTYSIADGMAFGFITYPLIKLALGKRNDISLPLLIISGLFLFDFIVKMIGI